MLKNSLWAVSSNIIHNVFLSIFFVVLARFYSTEDFAHFLIANTLYQFIACISTLGLGHWFIREIVNSQNRDALAASFMKIQLYFGVAFFVINMAASWALYNDVNIHILSALLGINIIFDNLIYSIKFINTAEFNQKQTFKILGIESFCKFLIGVLLFIYPLSIIALGIALIVVRVATFRYFLRIASSGLTSIRSFWRSKLSFGQIRELVYKNWAFVVVGGVSVAYWRIANVIIAKKLTLMDVANYEIAFKIFSVAQILPMMVITSMFPAFVKLYNDGNKEESRSLYRKMFRISSLYGILAYVFIYTFGDALIPLAFGSSYSASSATTKELFLTMLIFPTAFLQANILVSMKLEKFDMWFNIITLAIYVAACLTGLQYVDSLSVIGISLFASFILFHILQDALLIKKGITTFRDTVVFYAVTASVIICFSVLYESLQSYLVMALGWLIVIAGLLYALFKTDLFNIRTKTLKDIEL